MNPETLLVIVGLTSFCAFGAAIIWASAKIFVARKIKSVSHKPRIVYLDAHLAKNSVINDITNTVVRDILNRGGFNGESPMYWSITMKDYVNKCLKVYGIEIIA